MKRPMINEALTIARLYWGYTQAELAALLGVSQAMVSEIERGVKDVSMDMLDRYATALNVRKSQLMFFAEEIDGEPPQRKGKLLIADKVLKILKAIKPDDAQET